MKKDKKGKLVLSIIALIGGISVATVRLMNPDMTETRLFLEFWWLWTAILAVGALAFFITEAPPRK